MSTHSAIDIGSNAIRFAFGSLDNKGILRVSETGREPVRLGEKVFREGVLSTSKIEKAVSAIKKFVSYARESGVRRIHAVATSAVREAKNKDEFIEAVHRATGISIEVLDGEVEASLITRAVCHVLKLQEGSALIVNIGGGSTELSIVSDGALVGLESIEIGTVRLLHGIGEVKFTKELEESLLRLDTMLMKISGSEYPTLFVGTGGNVESIGKLKKQILDKGDTTKVTLSEFRSIFRKLEELSPEERIERLKLRPDRADVIYPAARILSVIFEKLNFNELLVPGVGLREGVLLASLHGVKVTEELLHSGERCQ